MPKLTYRLTIATDNRVIVIKEKGGNVHAGHGDDIHWAGDNNLQFTLRFADLDTGGEVWPFSQHEPKWPCAQFTGTLLNAGVAYYKYTIKVTDFRDLDPIIIVDH